MNGSVPFFQRPLEYSQPSLGFAQMALALTYSTCTSKLKVNSRCSDAHLLREWVHLSPGNAGALAELARHAVDDIERLAGQVVQDSHLTVGALELHEHLHNHNVDCVHLFTILTGNNSAVASTFYSYRTVPAAAHPRGSRAAGRSRPGRCGSRSRPASGSRATSPRTAAQGSPCPPPSPRSTAPHFWLRTQSIPEVRRIAE